MINCELPSCMCVSPAEERSILTQHLERMGSARGELTILEAGCGNSCQLDLSGVEAHLIGVDSSEHALRIREQAGDLDRAVIGDLRTVELDESSFDVIYNSFVLEHVENAKQVLENFCRWLKPGGILILRIPDRESAYGFLSRITPFWVHVLYKRYIFGSRNAGKPGYDPFPTVYDSIVSRQGIRRWCVTHRLTIREEVSWNYSIARSGLASWIAGASITALRVLSLGRLATDHVNLSYVIEKAAVDPVRVCRNNGAVRA